MSQTPNHFEAGRPNLQRALDQLPAHEPADSLWARIDAELGAEEAIARALPALPAHEPADDLWAAITAELDAAPAASPLTITPEPAPLAVRPLWPAYRRVAGLAAAILLLAGVFWAQWSRPAASRVVPRETITYSEEVVEEPAEARAGLASFDPLDEQGLAFIDAHCTSLPSVCQSDEFQELRTQLTELEAEEQRLQKDARRLGPTPELVRHQVQVTTLKASVTRELIQLLIS
ncbi:hypothetical protein [Hymenobacter persicinus]|uniref:Uncharacterized protein n=1 Tax=Hymenobacter persicinus TaxID=2025506 RepID=A0A4Q5LFE1_9BACT|nr:hypothetical protein [Hymenobacter persicinus]RYU81865.1 hypothetical protein EWM57_05645 [Hymenobacter persicinus]